MITRVMLTRHFDRKGLLTLQAPQTYKLILNNVPFTT